MKLTYMKGCEGDLRDRVPDHVGASFQGHKDPLPSTSTSFSSPSIFSIINTPVFIDYTQLLTPYNTFPILIRKLPSIPSKVLLTHQSSYLLDINHQQCVTQSSLLSLPLPPVCLLPIVCLLNNMTPPMSPRLSAL